MLKNKFQVLKNKFKILKGKFANFDWVFFKKALKIITPIVLSQVVVVAISFVDGIMVNGFHNEAASHLGHEKVDYAAVGVAGELWFAFQAFFSASMIVFSILYSQFVHNKKVFTDTAKFNFWFVMVMTLSVSALMFFAASPLVNLFFLSKAGPDVAFIKPIAIKYFKIMALGHIFISFAWAILNPLTIKGKTQYALYLAILALLLNFGLDYLFIYELNMGAEGSAWATMIAYAAQLCFALFFAWRHRDWFKGFSKLLTFNKFVVKEVFKRTLIFLSFLGMQIGFATATIIYSNLYGSEVIKPMAVGYTVSSIMFTVFAGVNRSVKVFIGPLLGQGKFRQAKEISKKLFWPNIFLSFVFAMVALISTTFFPDLMLKNTKDIRLAKEMIYGFSGLLIFFVINSYYSAIVETSGFQLMSNIFNYFFQVWAILPGIFIFSHYGANLDFTTNFVITQSFYIIAATIFYIDYKRFRWVRKITLT